jgi:hypothetical protein
MIEFQLIITELKERLAKAQDISKHPPNRFDNEQLDWWMELRKSLGELCG